MSQVATYPYVKGKYKTTNRPEYEAGLRQRGKLTVRISEDELKGWGPPERSRRKPGGQVQHEDHAVEIALTVGMVKIAVHWWRSERQDSSESLERTFPV